jgi:hydroxymethylpyrimidine pyrophosphatase-like HAD family hydrolase
LKAEDSSAPRDLIRINGMRLKALALDYDGTIADGGSLVPEVRGAIDRARESGLVVLIVTGRILCDLRGAVGDLTFVDAVVAENGAVVAFPAIGRSTVLHPPPSTAFIDQLRNRGINVDLGEVVIEADASAAPLALEILRALEQPLTLHFNRSRMMILPPGINKAIGLTAALTTLRLSLHNVLAIGDAENDHELLRSAEVGVAVEWGSPALKATADDIVKGSGPSAVASYIDSLVKRLSDHRSLPVRQPRRRLLLGTLPGGEQISLAVAGRNVVISGDPRSGKSWVAGLLCEQLILHGYSVCVIDPEGDYSSLEALPCVTVVGGDDPPPKPHELLRLLRHPDRSIILDLCRLPHGEKLEYLREALPQIAVVRQRTGLPHRLLIDEAHYFLRDAEILNLLGTNAGDCTAITYQASRLHPAVLQSAGVMLVTRATDPHEVAALAEATGAAADLDQWNQVLADLAVDEVALLPSAEESHGQLQRIRLVERLTPHVRHRTKYLDVPVATHHAFVFSRGGRPAGVTACTLQEFVDILGSTNVAVHNHVLRGDFSKWIESVFGDRQLAATIRRLENNYRLNRDKNINDAIALAVRSRYEFD